MHQKSSTTLMYGHYGTMHRVVCIFCCVYHNQYHETFSWNIDSLCVLSSACIIVLIILNLFCCQTQDCFSSVYAASEKGYTEVVDLLVQAGADVHLATTDEVHVCTHTVSSSEAAVVETNIRLINPRCPRIVKVTLVSVA